MDVLRRIFERDGADIAGVIIEPVLGNAQAIMPQPGFHEAIRALTKEFGALLIFDEVKTGFRFARGGAAEFFGVTPDLATFAKAMGNGYPAAAFQGGLAEVLNEKGLPHTFTGHPSMFGIYFAEQAPTEYRDWANSDHDLYDAIAINMALRGAMPEPDSREPWFLCEAHTKGDYADRIVSIFSDSLDAALDDRAHGTSLTPGFGAESSSAAG